jgi:hypothetical protein
MTQPEADCQKLDAVGDAAPKIFQGLCGIICRNYTIRMPP